MLPAGPELQAELSKLTVAQLHGRAKAELGPATAARIFAKSGADPVRNALTRLPQWPAFLLRRCSAARASPLPSLPLGPCAACGDETDTRACFGRLWQEPVRTYGQQRILALLDIDKTALQKFSFRYGQSFPYLFGVFCSIMGWVYYLPVMYTDPHLVGQVGTAVLTPLLLPLPPLDTFASISVKRDPPLDHSVAAPLAQLHVRRHARLLVPRRHHRRCESTFAPPSPTPPVLIHTVLD